MRAFTIIRLALFAILRAVTGSTAGAVFTETAPGIPPMPPITDSNYLFAGNSSAVTLGGNPASVSMDAWANDSYFLIDATDNGLDYLQDGSRLWTTLDITGDRRDVSVAPARQPIRLHRDEFIRHPADRFRPVGWVDYG
jgi:hypothetical protein